MPPQETAGLGAGNKKDVGIFVDRADGFVLRNLTVRHAREHESTSWRPTATSSNNGFWKGIVGGQNGKKFTSTVRRW